MLEYDSEYSDPVLKRILANQKVNQQLAAEDSSWQEFTALSDVENPSGLSKSDTSAQTLIDHDRLIDGFGFDQLQTLTKTYTVPRLQEINLDDLLKASTDGNEKVTLQLMKVHRDKLKKSGSTGSVSDEMMSFFEKYSHLFTESAKQAVLMAIKCLDFPLFCRLMRDQFARV